MGDNRRAEETARSGRRPRDNSTPADHSSREAKAATEKAPKPQAQSKAQAVRS